MAFKTAAGALMILVCTSCGWFGRTKEVADQMTGKSTLDVLKKAGEEDYDPPSDGKLTDKQVQMYVEVKKRERDLIKVSAQKLSDQAAKAKAAEQQGEKIESFMEGMK